MKWKRKDSIVVLIGCLAWFLISIVVPILIGYEHFGTTSEFYLINNSSKPIMIVFAYDSTKKRTSVLLTGEEKKVFNSHIDSSNADPFKQLDWVMVATMGKMSMLDYKHKRLWKKHYSRGIDKYYLFIHDDVR